MRWVLRLEGQRNVEGYENCVMVVEAWHIHAAALPG